MKIPDNVLKCVAFLGIKKTNGEVSEYSSWDTWDAKPSSASKTTYITEDKQYEVIDLGETIPAGQYIITATSDNAVYNSKLMVR